MKLPVFIEVCVFQMQYNLDKVLPMMYELKGA